MFQKQPNPILNPSADTSVWYSIWLRWWFPAGLVPVTMERSLAGARKYGVGLQPFNGRDAVQDAIEESLDHIAYTEQLVQEHRIRPILGTMLQILDVFSVWCLVTFSKERKDVR